MISWERVEPSREEKNQAKLKEKIEGRISKRSVITQGHCFQGEKS